MLRDLAYVARVLDYINFMSSKFRLMQFHILDAIPYFVDVIPYFLYFHFLYFHFSVPVILTLS